MLILLPKTIAINDIQKEGEEINVVKDNNNIVSGNVNDDNNKNMINDNHNDDNNRVETHNNDKSNNIINDNQSYRFYGMWQEQRREETLGAALLPFHGP